MRKKEKGSEILGFMALFFLYGEFYSFINGAILNRNQEWLAILSIIFTLYYPLRTQESTKLINPLGKYRRPHLIIIVAIFYVLGTYYSFKYAQDNLFEISTIIVTAAITARVLQTGDVNGMKKPFYRNGVQIIASVLYIFAFILPFTHFQFSTNEDHKKHLSELIKWIWNLTFTLGLGLLTSSTLGERSNKPFLVKIIRFDNRGFNCKPYTSPAYHHVFEFINNEVTDLKDYGLKTLKPDLQTPALNDVKWSGCFCFLEEYDPKLLSKNGALRMRRDDKRNIAFLPADTSIWVRNITPIGKNVLFYNEFMYPVEHQGRIHWFSESSQFDSYMWVKMRADVALERTRLWKEYNKSERVPEWLTEFYLMENQLSLLKKPTLIDKIKNWFGYLLEKILVH